MSGPHGQPDPAYNRMRRIDRDLAEMLGVVKGVLADGLVTTDEAKKLRQWCDAHPDIAEEWPGSALVRRLDHIFEDGEVSEAERSWLAELLHDLVGGEAGVILASSTATQLPLDPPSAGGDTGPGVRLHRPHGVRSTKGMQRRDERARWVGGGACDLQDRLLGDRDVREWGLDSVLARPENREGRGIPR